LCLADALIAANKNFDFLIVPFANHDYLDLRRGIEAASQNIPMSRPYVIRKRWDYLVAHLLGPTPPAGFAIAHEHRLKVRPSPRCRNLSLASKQVRRPPLDWIRLDGAPGRHQAMTSRMPGRGVPDGVPANREFAGRTGTPGQQGDNHAS